MSPLRSVGTIAAGRLFLIACQVVSIRALTTFLGPAEVGRSYIILSLLAWFGLVLASPVCTYVDRFLLDWTRSGSAKGYYIKFFRYLLLSAFLAVVFLSLAHAFWGFGIAIQLPFLILILAASMLAGPVSSAFLNGLNILEQRGWFVLLSNFLSWGGLGISIFLAMSIAPTAEFWITGQLVAQAVIAFIAGTKLWRLLDQSTGTAQVDYKHADFAPRVVVRFAWPLALGVAVFWIQTQGYRFILAVIANEAAVGFFAVAFAIGAGLMVAFEIVFTQFYQPLYYRAIAGRDKAGRVEAWNAYASAYLPIIVLIATFVALSGPYLLRLFTSAEFHQVGVVVAWAAAIEALRMISGTYYMGVLAERDTRILIIPSTMGAIVATLGVLYLAPWHVFHGTGLALWLGALTNMLGISVALKRKLPITLPWRRIAYAALMIVPLVVIFILAGKLVSTSDWVDALLILVVSGMYLLGAQFALARAWLHNKPIT